MTFDDRQRTRQDGWQGGRVDNRQFGAETQGRNPMALASVAIAALCLIAGAVLFFVGLHNPAALLFWLGIIPLVVGLFGLLHANDTWGAGKTLAGAGIGLSALSIVLGVLTLVLTDRDTGGTLATPPDTATVAEPIATPPADVTEAGSIDAVQVSGAGGGQPTVDIDLPLRVLEQETRLLTPGTGAPLESGQQLTVQMVGWRGDTGEQVSSTWEDGTTETFIYGAAQFEFLTTALEGANVGAQLLWASPTAIPGDDGQPVSILWFLEIEDAVSVPTRAEGTPVPPVPGLPTVTLAADGAPSIDIPADFSPSDELVAQTLIEGTGREVLPTDSLTVHYTGWLLDGTVFDSSWERFEPAFFPLNGVISGWQEGLAGQRVGSQVLLILPPEYGYGDRDMGTIPANSYLIFVVDILSAE